MQKSYIRNYAEKFNLFYGHDKCYDQMGNLVMFSQGDGKYVLYRSGPKWVPAKQGDLLIAIMNNTPIHGEVANV